MGKMLPIPAPLIDSTSLIANSSVRSKQQQRFFLPLIYLGATASLCYLFLFALVISNETSHPSVKRGGGERGRSSGFLKLALLGRSSEKQYKKNSVEPLWRVVRSKSNSKIETRSGDYHHLLGNQLVLSSSTSSTQSSSLPSRTNRSLSSGRKTLYSLRRKPEKLHNRKNGAWRSHPTKIWPGHQDLGSTILKITSADRKGYQNSSRPTGVYYYPWKKDEQCKNFNVHFAEKNTFKPRALVSFPGSGNSWLRYLIENASGYFTGSVYNDKQLYNSGLLGELCPPNDGTTIVQKTHHNVAGNIKNIKGYVKLSELMFGYRGILVIRNPYDALVSYRNYLKSRSTDRHTGIANDSEFDGTEWKSFVKTYISLWSSLIMSWIENSQDYLIVLYEDVQKNPREELIRILEYLDQPVDSTRLDCLMKQENLEGPFHRAHHLPEKTSSDNPLPLDSIPPASPTTTSQQDTKINYIEQPKQFSHYPQHPNDDHQNHQDDQTLLLLNSKKSQQQPHVQHQQQQHLQSLPPLSSSSSQTTTQVGKGNGKEQKEENKILSSSPSSPPPSSFQTIFPTNFQQNQYTSKMTSSNNGSSGGGRNTSAIASTTSTFLITDDNHHNHNNSKNNRLNKGSTILRLDLIIQDNIDKINRFFQHKSIPVQLHYSLRPSTIPYFLQNTTYYCNTTAAATIFPSTFPTKLFSA